MAEEDSIVGGIQYADLNECVRIVNEAKIDCLNFRFRFCSWSLQGEPKLGFDEMLAIKEATDTPLVLHGGTESHSNKFNVQLHADSKINVNTENQMAWTDVVRKVLAENDKVYDPRKIIGPVLMQLLKPLKQKWKNSVVSVKLLNNYNSNGHIKVRGT